jgi:hypothetical protein
MKLFYSIIFFENFTLSLLSLPINLRGGRRVCSLTAPPRFWSIFTPGGEGVLPCLEETAGHRRPVFLEVRIGIERETPVVRGKDTRGGDSNRRAGDEGHRLSHAGH